MKKLKNLFRAFWKDEGGFEFLQLAIVIVIVAMLAVVVYGIATSAQSKLEEANEMLNNIGPSTGQSAP